MIRYGNIIRIYLERRQWMREIQLLITQENVETGKVFIPAPIEWVEHVEGSIVPPDSIISLPLDNGQEMMDRLWEFGYRPSAGVSSTGQHEAQQNHIADLRDIVRQILGIK